MPLYLENKISSQFELGMSGLQTEFDASREIYWANNMREFCGPEFVSEICAAVVICSVGKERGSVVCNAAQEERSESVLRMRAW